MFYSVIYSGGFGEFPKPVWNCLSLDPDTFANSYSYPSSFAYISLNRVLWW